MEKLAGNINPQTAKIGKTIGTNAFLKSLITSCLMESILATYIINESFAKSEVWNDWLITGMTNQRLALFKLEPINSVSINSGTEMYNASCATREK